MFAKYEQMSSIKSGILKLECRIPVYQREIIEKLSLICYK